MPPSSTLPAPTMLKIVFMEVMSFYLYENAVIHSSKGYIQGYIGMAVSDGKNQIIISAQAAGSANECEHLPEILDWSEKNMKKAAGKERWDGKEKTVLCDSNYFSEGNLRACLERGIEAVIADSQEKRQVNGEGEKRYGAEDFKYHEKEEYYECPQGKKLLYKGSDTIKGEEVKYYRGSLTDCRSCAGFSKCIQSKKGQSENKIPRRKQRGISFSRGIGLGFNTWKHLKTKVFRCSFINAPRGGVLNPRHE